MIPFDHHWMYDHVDLVVTQGLYQCPEERFPRSLVDLADRLDHASRKDGTVFVLFALFAAKGAVHGKGLVVKGYLAPSFSLSVPLGVFFVRIKDPAFNGKRANLYVHGTRDLDLGPAELKGWTKESEISKTTSTTPILAAAAPKSIFRIFLGSFVANKSSLVVFFFDLFV